MLIKRENVGVALIFMVISLFNPNMCGIDGQMYFGISTSLKLVYA